MQGDEPWRLNDGSPDLRFFFFPASEAEVLPTWDSGGLRGTASNDIVLADATVGENYGFAISARPWAAAPMYAGGIKLRGKTAFVSVALGIAQASIDALTDLAKTRVRTMAASPMCEQPVLRDELGRAEAMLLAARHFFYRAIEDSSATLTAGSKLERDQVARIGQSCSHLADTSRNVTQTMYRLGGGASVYRSCLLDRCLRDVHVATQHASIGPRNYDEAARIKLGMDIA